MVCPRREEELRRRKQGGEPVRTAWREGKGGLGGVEEWTKEIKREKGCFVRN